MDAPKPPLPSAGPSLEDRVRTMETAVSQLETDIRDTLAYSQRFRGLNVLFATGILLVFGVYGLIFYRTATGNFSKAKVDRVLDERSNTFLRPLAWRAEGLIKEIRPIYEGPILAGLKKAEPDLRNDGLDQLEKLGDDLQGYAKTAFGGLIRKVVLGKEETLRKQYAFLDNPRQRENFQKAVERNLERAYDDLSEIVIGAYKKEIEDVQYTLKVHYEDGEYERMKGFSPAAAGKQFVLDLLELARFEVESIPAGD